MSAHDKDAARRRAEEWWADRDRDLAAQERADEHGSTGWELAHPITSTPDGPGVSFTYDGEATLPGVAFRVADATDEACYLRYQESLRRSARRRREKELERRTLRRGTIAAIAILLVAAASLAGILWIVLGMDGPLGSFAGP